MSIVKNIAKTFAITTAMIGAIEVAGRIAHKAKARDERKLNNAILDVFEQIGLTENDFERVLPEGVRTMRAKCAVSNEYDLLEPWKSYFKSKEQIVEELDNGVFKQSLWMQGPGRASVLYIANKENFHLAKITVHERVGYIKFNYEIIKLK